MKTARGVKDARNPQQTHLIRIEERTAGFMLELLLSAGFHAHFIL